MATTLKHVRVWATNEKGHKSVTNFTLEVGSERGWHLGMMIENYMMENWQLESKYFTSIEVR